MGDTPQSKERNVTFRDPKVKWTAVVVTVLLVLNLVVIILVAFRIGTEQGRQVCPSANTQRVVAPLCVPCEDGWLTEDRDSRGEEKEKEKEKEGGWRKYRDDGGKDMCCPLHHRSLSSALEQIYHTVLEEQQRTAEKASPSTPMSLLPFYQEPTSTEETVLFANNYKPSAHITGVQPFDTSKHYDVYNSSDADDRLQTFDSWPLRFEPYRSSTRGYVQRLTWGLVVPVTGLYRIHSTVNFYFDSYSQNTRQRAPQDRRPFHVVHQLSRYRRATDESMDLTQRNQTVSGDYTDGLTSFLVTVQHLEVGDIISITLSHRAAIAMRDRWHSQGLFLLQ